MVPRSRPTGRSLAGTVALALVVLGLVVAPVGGALVVHGGGASGPADGGATDGSAGAAAQVGPATDCNYAALYDRTIDSVVSVRSQAGLGSGFVYDPNVTGADATGTETANATYVVTNAHVVGDASTVSIQFASEETRQGTVVGRDRSTDLAVVRVADAPASAEPLSLVEDRPQHGNPVAALGNPFGLEETITHGIVSGVNRSLPTRTGYAIPNTIQTDAPISPGNSGGPLVTCDGRVVGVTTAGIAARGAENLGFAVSASVVEQVLPRLVANGTFEHAFLGVAVGDVTPTVAEANDLQSTDGLLVTGVVEGSPADAALEESTRATVVDEVRVPVGGDVILAVGGTPVDTPEDLASVLLTGAEPGERLTMTVRRNGEVGTVSVELAERPEPTAR